MKTVRADFLLAYALRCLYIVNGIHFNFIISTHRQCMGVEHARPCDGMFPPGAGGQVRRQKGGGDKGKLQPPPPLRADSPSENMSNL